jgi:hypothetical protein
MVCEMGSFEMMNFLQSYQQHNSNKERYKQNKTKTMKPETQKQD